MKSSKMLVTILALFILSATTSVFGQDAPAPTVEETTAEVVATVDPVTEVTDKVNLLSVGIDTIWVMVTAFLVFFMNLGFGLVESGLARSKNTVNILTKNFVVFALASLAFWVVGFGLMFGNGNVYFGTDGVFFLADMTKEGAYFALAWTQVPIWAKFFFQLVFAGTAATIVSGAVAERIKFPAFMIFAFVLVAILYPVTGHWIWGGGWLQTMGFWDFAGSSVVHSVGGWAALAGVLVLGPRFGKYGPKSLLRLRPQEFT